jgi:hypothetical protein
MTKDMGMHVLALERRAVFRGAGCVHGYSSLYGVRTEPATRPCREQWVTCPAGAFGHPDSQHLLSGTGEGDGSLLAALSLASDVASSAEDHIGAVEADEFRDSQAGLESEYE